MLEAALTQTPFHARARRLVVQDKIVEYNCARSKILLPFLLQIPLWLSVSMALRRLVGTLPGPDGVLGLDSADRSLQMVQEGGLWFPDLTAPDPTGCVLPLLLGSLYLGNLAVRTNDHPVGRKKPKSAKVKNKGGSVLY